uniref:Uncharacterized protein n=1 Tax=Triticum urartu TaxID=4572 RepID=A0A8R7TI56_TRIUA
MRCAPPPAAGAAPWAAQGERSPSVGTASCASELAPHAHHADRRGFAAMWLFWRTRNRFSIEELRCVPTFIAPGLARYSEAAPCRSVPRWWPESSSRFEPVVQSLVSILFESDRVCRNQRALWSQLLLTSGLIDIRDQLVFYKVFNRSATKDSCCL